MGFLESLTALVFIQRSLNPLLTLEHGADVVGEVSVFSAVPRREPHLDGEVTADGVEVVRGTIVHLAFVVVNPFVISQGMDEGATIAVRESDAACERGAVGVALQSLQDATDIIGWDHIIIVHEGHILALRLRQKHITLLSDGHLSAVTQGDNLNLIRLLCIEGGKKLRQCFTPVVQCWNKNRKSIPWSCLVAHY